MAELELTRVAGDRRRYELERVGTLRLGGWFSRSAAAEAGAERWTFARRGLLSRAVQATDALGERVGTFEPRAFRRSGTLHWCGLVLALRPASAWRERYALVDGEHEIAVLQARSWGRHPVVMSVDEPAMVEPGLLLFAAFVVRGLAEDADGSAGAAGSAATSGG